LYDCEDEECAVFVGERREESENNVIARES